MTTQLQIPTPIDGAVDPAAGVAAKSAALGTTRSGMDPEWAAACDRAIAQLAARGEPFQAADLVAEGLVDEPTNHHWWGVVFARAAHEGHIRHAGVTESARVTTKRSLCRLWVGARPEEAAA